MIYLKWRRSDCAAILSESAYKIDDKNKRLSEFRRLIGNYD